MVMADLFMVDSSFYLTNNQVCLNIGDVFGTLRGGYEERRGRKWDGIIDREAKFGVGGGRRGLLFLLRR